MNKVLTGTGLWLALFAAACSGSDSTSDQSTPLGSASNGNMVGTGAGAAGGMTNTQLGSMGVNGAVGGSTNQNNTVGNGAGASTQSGATGATGTMNNTMNGMLGSSGGASGMAPGGSGGNVNSMGMAGAPGMQGTGGATGGGGTPSTTGGAGGAGDDMGGSAGMGGGGGEGDIVKERDEPTLITSGNNAFWTIGEVTEGGSNANVTVNTDQKYQDWKGWGGTFNEMGWDALSVLSQEDRDLAIKLLFDYADGAAFTYGRIPIGSSDYGLSRYSLDETANDYEMNDFSIDRDKQALIPYIQAALAVNPDISFWGSPWSPPPWMKDNNAYDRGNMKNDQQTLQAHALYLARFVEEYEKEGIYVKAIHPQNEPGYGQDYPSCAWSANQFADYIGNYLGPLFAERLPDREIWLGTMSNPDSRSIVQTVMGNGTASGFVKGIGVQWGQDQYAGQYTSQYDVTVMQTEHRCGNYPWEGGYQQTAPNDYAYAEESWGLIKTWLNANVNAYSAWNMVLDTVGRSLDTVRPWAQNALLAVDRNAKKLVITPTYYVFRHFSQYVDPGAVRVGTNGGDAFAFQNPDGSVVTILHNGNGQESQVTLSVGGTMLQFSIPGSGWATVNWQGN